MAGKNTKENVPEEEDEEEEYEIDVSECISI